MTPSLASLTAAQSPFDASRRKALPTRHDQLIKQTQRLVSQTFYGTMLKQMRNSPFKSKMFDGGRGGEAFSSLLDEHLADRMSRGAGGKLVNSIVRHIERNSGAGEPELLKPHSASRAARSATYSAKALSAIRAGSKLNTVAK